MYADFPMATVAMEKSAHIVTESVFLPNCCQTMLGNSQLVEPDLYRRQVSGNANMSIEGVRDHQ